MAKKIFRGVGYFFCAALILLCILLAVLAAGFGSGGTVGLLGFNLYLIETDSVADVPKGSVVLARECRAYDLSEGMPVLYRADGAPVLGYVDGVRTEDGVYYIAVSVGDSSAEFPENDLIGSAEKCSEFLGMTVTFLRTPLGILAVALLPCAALIIYDLVRAAAARRPLPEVTPQYKNTADGAGHDEPASGLSVRPDGNAAYSRSGSARPPVTADSVLFSYAGRQRRADIVPLTDRKRPDEAREGGGRSAGISGGNPSYNSVGEPSDKSVARGGAGADRGGRYADLSGGNRVDISVGNPVNNSVGNPSDISGGKSSYNSSGDRADRSGGKSSYNSVGDRADRSGGKSSYNSSGDRADKAGAAAAERAAEIKDKISLGGKSGGVTEGSAPEKTNGRPAAPAAKAPAKTAAKPAAKTAAKSPAAKAGEMPAPTAIKRYMDSAVRDGATTELPAISRKSRDDAFFSRSEAPQIAPRRSPNDRSARAVIDLEDALATAEERSRRTHDSGRRSAEILASKSVSDLITEDDDSLDRSRYEVDDILAGIDRRKNR